MPEGQAEAQARALSSALTDFQEERLESLATKSDIMKLERDIKEMEMRLIIRLGAMLAASIAIVAALVKLL